MQALRLQQRFLPGNALVHCGQRWFRGRQVWRRNCMAESQGTSAPIENTQELVDHLAAGAKPKETWRIGTEHEKFGFRRSDLSPMPYEGPQGIGTMLKGLQRFGWAPVYEGENVIALQMGDQSITLEPGGQLELSGGLLKDLHETCNEVGAHISQVKEVAVEMDVAFAGFGFHPSATLDQCPVMPKGRYGIMRRYMPTKGSLGLNMMFRTATVQVNLDFSSEDDMVRKFRVALALQPVCTALFANSPFTEGKPNGFLSFRSQVWTDTDPDRCGILPFVFEDGMGFERYANYVLDVPMYFVHRGNEYIDASGQSFRDFLAGKLPALPGEKPILSDWEDHLTTVFPEVRLKTFLEMRGADGGPNSRLCAMPAMWVGLLYDSTCLDAAWDLVTDWTPEEHTFLRENVPVTGLRTEFRGQPLSELAKTVIGLAHDGLSRRAILDFEGHDETSFLNPLKDMLEGGQTLAEEALEAYRGRWHESVAPMFEEYAY